jgi:tetratricopeptide (TPR) repeat protein
MNARAYPLNRAMPKLRYLLFAFLPAWWCPAQTATPPSATSQGTITALQQQAAQQPPVKGASRQLGIAYYRSGKLIDAEHAFAAAMAQDPADLESVQMRGLTLYRLGQPAAAIPYLERVRQWMPNANADANHVLGLAYMQARRYDDARGAFAAQYGVRADSAAAYLLTGEMLLAADLPEFAAQDAQRALALTPNLPLAHFMLGEVYLYKSDVAHALEQFEQERAVNPAYPAVYDRLGDVYTRMGQYQQAQESLTRAISLDVSSTGPFIQMGKVFLRRGDPESAAMYLQHAVKMDPGNYISHTLLGQAYRAVGKEEDAKRELDAASQIHASSQLKLQPVQ